MYTRLQYLFPSGKVSSQLKSRKLICRHQQYQHVGNEKHSDVLFEKLLRYKRIILCVDEQIMVLKLICVVQGVH